MPIRLRKIITSVSLIFLLENFPRKQNWKKATLLMRLFSNRRNILPGTILNILVGQTDTYRLLLTQLMGIIIVWGSFK